MGYVLATLAVCFVAPGVLNLASRLLVNDNAWLPPGTYGVPKSKPTPKLSDWQAELADLQECGS